MKEQLAQAMYKHQSSKKSHKRHPSWNVLQDIDKQHYLELAEVLLPIVKAEVQAAVQAWKKETIKALSSYNMGEISDEKFADIMDISLSKFVELY